MFLTFILSLTGQVSVGDNNNLKKEATETETNTQHKQTQTNTNTQRTLLPPPGLKTGDPPQWINKNESHSSSDLQPYPN
jgi:hypothetical protein